MMLVDVQTLSIVIAAAGVFLAAINSIISRRRTEKTERLTLETRQAQLFMQIYNRWTARDFSESYVNYRYHYNIRDHVYNEELARFNHPSTFPLDVHTEWQMLAAYFEGIGVLVKEHLIDVNLVENLFQGRIIAIWDKIFPDGSISEARTVANDPKMHEHFEHLYHVMKQRQQQQVIVST